MLSFFSSNLRAENMEPRQKVLVVDDEELSQDFLRFFLSKKFDVYTCGNINTFYSLINKVDFDLILMDVFLRDHKDGYQLTKELRETEKYKNRSHIECSRE